MPAPTPAGKPTAAGNRYHFMFFADDDGVITGSSPTHPANGSGSGSIRIWATKRAAPATPQPDIVIDEGDDGEILTEYQFRSIASRAFVAEVAIFDPVFAGVLSNMPVRSVGAGQFVSVDVNNVPIYNCGTILQSRSIDPQSGAQQWQGIIIPRATAAYLGRAEFNDRTAGVFRFMITPQPAGWSPIGYTYIDNNGNPKQMFDDYFKGYPNPLTLHAFSGDGIVTAIPVDYTPVNRLPLNSAIVMTTPPSGQGGTLATVSSVQTTSPFSITVSAAPATATRVGLLYEFTPS